METILYESIMCRVIRTYVLYSLPSPLNASLHTNPNLSRRFNANRHTLNIDTLNRATTLVCLASQIRKPLTRSTALFSTFLSLLFACDYALPGML